MLMEKSINNWPAAPYKGLGFYGPADVPLFAGRESDVLNCAHLLAHDATKVLILHGPTGSGKSSFLRAGLIPYMETKGLDFKFLKDKDERLKAIFIRATDRPLNELSKSVYEFAKEDVEIKTPKGQVRSLGLSEVVAEETAVGFVERVGNNSDALLNVLHRLTARLTKTLVLIIDQGEEVLTLRPGSESDSLRKGFFDFIAKFSGAKLEMKLLIAIRTEYFGRFSDHIRQDDFIQPPVVDYLLSDFTNTQLVQAIERPTSSEEVEGYGIPYEHYKFKFEEGLAQTIADELMSKKLVGGALPVMQIICDRLYQNIRPASGDGRWVITEADYRALGGIEEQVDQYLDERFEEICRSTGIGDSKKINAETARWKDVLSTLATSQADGTVTTEFIPVEELRGKLRRTSKAKSTLDFQRTLKFLSNDEVRILRRLDLLDLLKDRTIECYSLGHDVVGLALYRWKSRRSELTGTGKPVSAWNRALRFSFKELFKALTRDVAQMSAGARWRTAGETASLVSAAGPGKGYDEIAWLLILRSLIQAAYDLVKESEAVLNNRARWPISPIDVIIATLDLSLEQKELVIDESFFFKPRALPILRWFKKPFRQWLQMLGLNRAEANSIADRLPSYFIYALHDQWRERPEDYTYLREALDSPFTKSGAIEQAWQHYAALLQKQVDESMFVEAFSLRQVYVPARGFFYDWGEAEKGARFDPRAAEPNNGKRVVVDLEMELKAWLANNDPSDAVRVISGGPGSGKSSFTKMFAARRAQASGRRVLFVPIHLLELSDDLEEAVRKFTRYVDPDLTNPLSVEEIAAPFLLIFDGLDELAMQGKLAAELAQQFVRETRATTERLNFRGNHLKVLISGRELAVQSNAAEFKRPRQILHILPYFVHESFRAGYTDPHNLLEQDQRQQWWLNYGRVSGNNYKGLPKELDRDDLTEITSQPLLNYLVALSFAHGGIDLATQSNLNVIYYDLLKTVYERGWAGGRNLAVQSISEDKFTRWLEEIAVAAWHGDGRTTTVEEIKGHVETGGAANLLNLFEEGADRGITRLLMAFYFRRAGARESGEKTFEFTQKSFGEYLAARRIVRLLRDIHEEIERYQENVDKGWNEREALVRWIRLCGPAVVTEPLLKFIGNEVKLCGIDYASYFQKKLCNLIEFALRNGMPMESLNLMTYKEVARYARNAEESLLAALSVCARATSQISTIKWPSPVTFGELLSRLQGQRSDYANAIVLSCLDYMNLDECVLYGRDLIGANLQRTSLRKAEMSFVNLMRAQLAEVDFEEADLRGANLEGANLEGANLEGANLEGARM